MTQSSNTPMNPKSAWLTDLHLDVAPEPKIKSLLNRLADDNHDHVIVTGDVSSGPFVVEHLRQIANACWPKKTYFVTGNHDYYDSSIRGVNRSLHALCAENTNLQFLDGTQLITIGDHTGLIGCAGWADARAGFGTKTIIDSPDRRRIEEFRILSQSQMLHKMVQLGNESARSIRKILPYALSVFDHIIIATHVPPFPSSAKYDGKICGYPLLPHFCNLSAGLAIKSISTHHKSRITVLSGHTHCGVDMKITDRIRICVGSAIRGSPCFQRNQFFC